MDFLIKNALIIYPGSTHHLKRKDILVVKGRIQKISNRIVADNAKKIESEDLHCSLGWMDIGTHLGEPGYEHRETIDSLSESASRGGYTAIAPFPTTNPIIQSVGDMLYQSQLFENKLQDYIPISALSKNMKGHDLTEMRDLIQANVKAFTDGLNSQVSAGLLLRALEYIKGTSAKIIRHSSDYSLIKGGQMHEGAYSIQLGLLGLPSIAEIIGIKRDLELTKYSNQSIIFHCLSTSEGLETIVSSGNDKISSTVSYLNLILDDSSMTDFDPNLKVTPPLRSQKDREGLLQAAKKSEIDAIVSNHVAIEAEKKKLEFSYASPGATGYGHLLFEGRAGRQSHGSAAAHQPGSDPHDVE